MTRELLSHIDYFDAATARLDEQIDRLMAPFADARDRFDTIPGIGKRNAEIIVAEIGIDMLPRCSLPTDRQTTRRPTSFDRHRSHDSGDLLAPARR